MQPCQFPVRYQFNEQSSKIQTCFRSYIWDLQLQMKQNESFTKSNFQYFNLQNILSSRKQNKCMHRIYPVYAMDIPNEKSRNRNASNNKTPATISEGK